MEETDKYQRIGRRIALAITFPLFIVGVVVAICAAATIVIAPIYLITHW